MVQLAVILAVSLLIGCAVVVLELVRGGGIRVKRRRSIPADRRSTASRYRPRVALVFAIVAVGLLLLITPMLMASQGPEPSPSGPAALRTPDATPELGWCRGSDGDAGAIGQSRRRGVRRPRLAHHHGRDDVVARRDREGDPQGDPEGDPEGDPCAAPDADAASHAAADADPHASGEPGPRVRHPRPRPPPRRRRAPPRSPRPHRPRPGRPRSRASRRTGIA